MGLEADCGCGVETGYLRTSMEVGKSLGEDSGVGQEVAARMEKSRRI